MKYTSIPLAFVALLVSCATPTVDQQGSLSGENLFKRVAHYAAIGDHRTGDEGDAKTTAWLSGELARLGFDVELQPFGITQFSPAKQILVAHDSRLAVFPHWPPTPTGPLNAPLASYHDGDLSGKIAYLSPEEAGDWYKIRPADLAAAAAAKGALALVIAPPHPSGEIYMTNAALPSQSIALPIPTVVLAAQDDVAMQAALDSHETVKLTSEGKYRDVEANNILARYPKKLIPDAPWVVISTPTSGWFRCAGERGSGIALWLGLADRIARGDGRNLNWLFIANSGHELAFAGAHASMHLAPSPDDVRLWLHLGASIGARQWSLINEALVPLDAVHEYNQLFYQEKLQPLVRAVFGNLPDLETLPGDKLRRTNSELGEILDAGYPALGFVGPHRFFHTPLDLPAVTSQNLLAPYGEALLRLADELEAEAEAEAEAE